MTYEPTKFLIMPVKSKSSIFKVTSLSKFVWSLTGVDFLEPGQDHLESGQGLLEPGLGLLKDGIGLLEPGQGLL